MSGLWFFRCCAVRIMWEMTAIVNSITEMFFFFYSAFCIIVNDLIGFRAQECYATTTSALEQKDKRLKARTFLICSICAVAGMIVWLRNRATRIAKGRKGLENEIYTFCFYVPSRNMFWKTYLSSDGPTSPQECVKLNKSPTAEELLPFLVYILCTFMWVGGGGSPHGHEMMHLMSTTGCHHVNFMIMPLHVSFQLFSNKNFWWYKPWWQMSCISCSWPLQSSMHAFPASTSFSCPKKQ